MSVHSGFSNSSDRFVKFPFFPKAETCCCLSGRERKNIWRERLYFDASKVPALTFSLHSLSWFFRVMQLEPALICSRRFLLFLNTKEHINLAESSDISLQHLDVAVLHHLPCKIVLPHCRRGQQEWGSEQMTAYTCGKYRESNHFIMMGVMWDECHMIYEYCGTPTFPSMPEYLISCSQQPKL